jgi:hypothetical protein
MFSTVYSLQTIANTAKVHKLVNHIDNRIIINFENKYIGGRTPATKRLSEYERLKALGGGMFKDEKWL